MTDNKEYRSASWEKGQDGKISGYAVVFSSRAVMYKDPVTGTEYKEEIDPHALDCANMDDVVLRVNHEGKVLARTRNGSLKLIPDSKGLRIEADMTGSEESRNVYEAVKNGLYDKMSFAFTVAEDSFDNTSKTRRIVRIERLFDVAIVDFPAYDATSVSARNRFESFTTEDRKAFYNAENRKALTEIKTILANHGIENRNTDFYKPIPGIDLTERETIEKQMLEIYERCAGQANGNAALIGSEPLAQLRSLEDKLMNISVARITNSELVAAGKGTFVRSFSSNIKPEERKLSMDEIRSKFYNELIEKRAAADTSGMINIIPVEILDHAFHTGNNGILPFVSLTHIANGGNVRIPYLTDKSTTVSAHTQNAAITPANMVPDIVTITHAEYQQTLGYSYLGMKVCAEDMQNIVENALIGAMNVKLDSVALGAIDALTWVTTAGATKNAVAWATSGSPLLSEILALMKLLPAQYSSGAKFFMNKATILSVIQNSTGNTDSNASNAMYNVSVLDGLARLFGTQVVEDSNAADGVVYYGNPNAVHMNIAGEVELSNWRDRDALTEKFQVACAAGAGCEAGAFVKGANSFS